MTFEEQYLNLCKDVLDNGIYKGDRTHTGVYSVFGAMMRHDLQEGFPLLTTKKVNFKLIAGELLWFLSGRTDEDGLRHYQGKAPGSHTIWSDDFNKFWDGLKEDSFYRRHKEGGKIYGRQLRDYYVGDAGKNVDQLVELINNILAVKENPDHPMGRRLICSFWNPYDHLLGDKKWCALPACHTDFQCYVINGYLNLRFSLRSNDLFLGNPYNFASYSLLCHILAQLTGLKAGQVVYFGTDVHIYSNHIEQVKLQLTRTPRSMPVLVMPEFNNLDQLLDLTGEDFKMEVYDPYGFIKAPQAS